MKLPKVNQFGFFEIRLESIGGLGANSAGKMIADAAILSQDLNGASFSSYGSEKKGSPIKTFVRLCDNKTPVRINSVVEVPHILAVFHMNLMKNPETLMGVNEDTVIILNTAITPDEARAKYKIHAGTVVCLDAIKISREQKLPATNTPMMGAMLKYMPFIDKNIIVKKIESQFAKRPEVIPPNIEALERGANEGVAVKFAPTKAYPYIPYKKTLPRYGSQTQIHGGIIVENGNSALKDLSTGRIGVIPVFHEEHCIHCGQCDVVCPDMALTWKKESDGLMYMKGVDYQYCKGCLKCVEICPGKPDKETKEKMPALTKELEADYNTYEITKPHYDFQEKLGTYKPF